MSPPDGIAMCQYDVSWNVTEQGESIHAGGSHYRDRRGKAVFQLHGASAYGSVVFRKEITQARLLDFLSQQPRFVVVMEACASAHGWGGKIASLSHEGTLIAPIYVRVSGLLYMSDPVHASPKGSMTMTISKMSDVSGSGEVDLIASFYGSFRHGALVAPECIPFEIAGKI